MSDHARFQNIRKNTASPTNNVTVRHLGGKLIRRFNAILQWNNCRVRAEHRANSDGGLRNHPRLDGHQHNINLPYPIGIIRSRECARRKLSITLRTLYAESPGTQRFQVRSAGNEGYIMLAGLDESTAEIRADGPRAKDGNPHHFLLRRAELAVAGVAEARHNKAALIQALIKAGDMDADIRMIALQTLNSLRRGD